MEFCFEQVDTLPPLAWCARMMNGSNDVVVFHGSHIETDRDSYFEGAWDGSFEGRKFVDAHVFMGSGGQVTDEGIVFASPTHTLERLHLIELKNEIFISNSLPFLLREANDACDPTYLYYHHDLDTIAYGLKKYIRFIPTKKGNRVRLEYHCNVLISKDLRVRRIEKSEPPAPSNFNEYYRFLLNSTAALQGNASAFLRKVKYNPLTSISTGYDSPACAVLAKKGAHCTEAVTFNRGWVWRSRQAIDDSGSQIGHKLGLTVKEYDRTSYRKQGELVEAVFLACGASGQDVVMATLGDVLPGRVFYTGFHGDCVWNVRRPASPFMERGFSGGISLSEFRLQIGFIHAPLPFMGSVNHAAIKAISTSDEMKPWSIGESYNRPIPRRIVETNGVARELFAYQKKAATQFLGKTSAFSEKSRTHFLNYLQDIHSPLLFYYQIKHFVMRGILRGRVFIAKIIKRVMKKRGRQNQAPISRHKYYRLDTRFLLTFHWGNELMMKRYIRNPDLQEQCAQTKVLNR